jgi:ribonuclease PH
VEEGIPKWLMGSGKGWVSAEYGMLPRSTHTRIRRDKAMSGGRTQEISRLIGRSLRAAVDLEKLGERQINIDCDVIQADGGTRTAAITGGFVALALCLKFMKDQGQLIELPLKNYVAAVSCGLHGEEVLLDLDYDEDFACGADVNFVLTDSSEWVEIQGTAEGQTISTPKLMSLMELAQSGCRQLFAAQSKIVGDFFSLKS